MYFSIQDADKKHQHQQQQRRKNWRPQHNLATNLGGAYSAVSSQQYLEIISSVAFSSLPPIHIGDAEPLMGVVGGEFSRSFPLPASNSYLEPPTSNERGLLPNLAKGNLFCPHWPEHAVEEAIEKGNAFSATFRVNAHNRQEAYCTIEGLPVDVLINGFAAQNRAIEGDMVAIMLDPVPCWTKLKGSNMPINPVPGNDSDLSLEVRGVVGEASASQELVNANRLLPMGRGFHENGSTNGYVHGYIKNVSETTYMISDGCKGTAPQNISAGCASEQDETARALARICAIINSCPTKRPTGRVIAIVKKSPRRGAVIGFLAAKEFLLERGGNERQINRQSFKKDKQMLLSGYVQLLPTDPKLPKMVVSVNSLPYFAQEMLVSGDETLGTELIAAQIDEWSEKNPSPVAHIIQFLGRSGEIEPHIAAILFENLLRESEFSPEATKCIPNLPWGIPEEEFETRKDLRNVCTFTIDPSTAIDLDDALSVEIVSDEILRIGVHIADVSHFVFPDSALDNEAQIRSTSVYILQHKLPMLPPEFSEGLCSLLPGADRLTFSITWDINRSGNIVDRWIGRSVIQSCCKLSYELVQGIINELVEPAQCNSSESSHPHLHGNFEWNDVVSSIKSLYEISMRLRESRFKGGALWLDTSKIGFLFDECGSPYDSFLLERKESCFLVEEFMLLANRSVAEVISMAFPESALLRRHPEPNPRKLRDFEAFWSKHGFELDTSSSGQLHQSLSKIREKLKDDTMLFDILVSFASRSMQSAAYFCTGELRGRENSWAHYALSVPYYTHFTSPIRRYPDIVVHRILSAALDAEEFLNQKHMLHRAEEYRLLSNDIATRCFTGLHFNKNAAESDEGKEALKASALKFKVPGCEVLTEVAAYCNERKLASKHAEEAGEKLYLWTLLKKKEILVCKARVMGLGPRFMSVYIHKFGIERRICYDEVESLSVEWLQMTSTLVLDLVRLKRTQRRACNWKSRPIEDTALVIYPSEDIEVAAQERNEPRPAFFPLVLSYLSTVPVALHAIGGDGSPLEIGARLYMSSYFR